MSSEKQWWEKSSTQNAAEWDAKAGTPKGGSSNNYNYQSDNKGCWSSFVKIIKWIFIIIAIIVVFAMIFGN